MPKQKNTNKANAANTNKANATNATNATNKVSLMNYKFEQDESKEKASAPEVVSFTYHEVQTANLLIVGATGTGKTTFLNTLRNPQYVSEYEIDSQTSEAEIAKNLFQVDNSFHMIQVIDTPGFGDSSAAATKSDFELEEMILKFVKQGVTELQMVLITIRYGIRMEAGQIKTIQSVLKFLGSQMRENAAVLCTFAEGVTKEEKVEWIKKGNQSNIKELLRYCKNKVFFTGMTQKGNAMDKQVFAKSLRKEQTRIIRKALASEPIKIAGEEAEAVTNQFKIYESAAKDSLSLKKLLPQIPNLAMDVEALKKQLTDHEDDERAIALMEKYFDVNVEQIQAQVTQWSRLQASVEEYIGKGQRVQDDARLVRDQYKKLRIAVEELSRLKFQLAVFDGDSETEDYEIVVE